LNFISLPDREDLGLLTVRTSATVLDWARDCVRAAKELFLLQSLARGLSAEDMASRGNQLSASLSQLGLTFDSPVDDGNDWFSKHWDDPDMFGECSGLRAAVADAAHVLVTHFLNVLKHGELSAGVSLSLSRSATLRGFQLSGRNSRRRSIDDSRLSEARDGGAGKIASSMLTLHYLEKRSAQFLHDQTTAFRIRQLPLQTAGQIVTWGFEMLWG
jgi:hypothetical protein